MFGTSIKGRSPPRHAVQCEGDSEGRLRPAGLDHRGDRIVNRLPVRQMLGSTDFRCSRPPARGRCVPRRRVRFAGGSRVRGSCCSPVAFRSVALRRRKRRARCQHPCGHRRGFLGRQIVQRQRDVIAVQDRRTDRQAGPCGARSVANQEPDRHADGRQQRDPLLHLADTASGSGGRRRTRARTSGTCSATPPTRSVTSSFSVGSFKMPAVR